MTTTKDLCPHTLRWVAMRLIEVVNEVASTKDRASVYAHMGVSSLASALIGKASDIEKARGG